MRQSKKRMTLPGTVEPHGDLYWTFQIIGPPDPTTAQHNAQSKPVPGTRQRHPGHR